MRGMINIYEPEVIVVGKPNRMYNVIASHNRYIGILCMLAEEQDIALVELNDMTARATLWPGKGGYKKDQIQKLTGIEDPDRSDAYVFAHAYAKMLEAEE